MRTAGRVVTALVAACAPVLLPAASAQGAQTCVGVIVDARLLGGDVTTGCANGDPGSGLEALTKAGYAYTPRPRDGLVCQVDGVPACTDTTTSTYWSYWYRNPGSTRWTYAAQGAGGHDPEPGALEAWVWQDGGRREPPNRSLASICPHVTEPPVATARTPSATPTKSSRTVSTRKSATTKVTTSPSGRTSASTPATQAPATSPSEPSDPSDLSDPSTGAATTPTPAGDPDPTRTTAAAATGDALPPWLGLVVGAGLVAALGAAAVMRVRAGGSP